MRVTGPPFPLAGKGGIGDQSGCPRVNGEGLLPIFPRLGLVPLASEALQFPLFLRGFKAPARILQRGGAGIQLPGLSQRTASCL